MKRWIAAAMLAAIPMLSAQAETSIQAGSWKVTTTTVANGMAAPPRVNNRCLSAEQAADAAKTFSPEFGGVNSACERTDFEAKDRALHWRLQCKGQFDMDVIADFNFESPIRYTATIATKGMMAGQMVVNSKQNIVGEYDGACP